MKLIVTFDSAIRTLFIRIGIVLIAASLVLFTSCIVGLFEFSVFDFAGHSGIRTLAGLAVLGCVTSAIASMED